MSGPPSSGYNSSMSSEQATAFMKKSLEGFLAFEAAKVQSAKAAEDVAKSYEALTTDAVEVQAAIDGMLGGLPLDEGSCTACGVSGVQLKVCSRCRRVKYCGQDCQRSDWKAGHRGACHDFLEKDVVVGDKKKEGSCSASGCDAAASPSHSCPQCKRSRSMLAKSAADLAVARALGADEASLLKPPPVNRRCLHDAPASKDGGAALAPAILQGVEGLIAGVNAARASGGDIAVNTLSSLRTWTSVKSHKLPRVARSMAVDAAGNADWGMMASFCAVADFAATYARAARDAPHEEAVVAGAAAATRIMNLTSRTTIADLRQYITCGCLGKPPLA